MHCSQKREGSLLDLEAKFHMQRHLSRTNNYLPDVRPFNGEKDRWEIFLASVFQKIQSHPGWFTTDHKKALYLLEYMKGDAEIWSNKMQVPIHVTPSICRVGLGTSYHVELATRDVNWPWTRAYPLPCHRQGWWYFSVTFPTWRTGSAIPGGMPSWHDKCGSPPFLTYSPFLGYMPTSFIPLAFPWGIVYKSNSPLWLTTSCICKSQYGSMTMDFKPRIPLSPIWKSGQDLAVQLPDPFSLMDPGMVGPQTLRPWRRRCL